MKRRELEPTEAETIAEFCRLIREREGKSTREWADELGLVFTYISKIERGDNSQPLEYLKKLKKKLTRRELDYVLDLLLES